MAEDKEKKSAIIAGSLRTLAQLVPLAGGALAQAWSEFVTYAENRRTQQFFEQLAQSLAFLEARHEELRQNVAQLPDAAESLERCVDAAKREVSEVKRAMYSTLYSHFIANPGATTRDERIDLVQQLEQLTENDLGILMQFGAGGGVLRGDMVTGTTHGAWSTMGDNEPDDAWLNEYGHVVQSIAKLIARGLLVETRLNAMFASHGESGSSFNQFRKTAWAMTPLARKLVVGIKGPGAFRNPSTGIARIRPKPSFRKRP